jgi:hypothetical protein
VDEDNSPCVAKLGGLDADGDDACGGCGGNGGACGKILSCPLCTTVSAVRSGGTIDKELDRPACCLFVAALWIGEA